MTTRKQPTRALSVLIHGDSKAGKSTLANTAPAPRVLLDAEMAYRFLPGKKIFWDPTSEAPPQADGSWETCVVIVRSYTHMVKAYEWLNSGAHPFVSVVVDSISEIQSRAKDDLAESGRMSQQLWGDLLYEMDKLVRGFRDLTEHPTRPLTAVVVTAMTQMRNGKFRPYVQGQMSVKLPYFLDVIGYLYTEVVPHPTDPTQPPTKYRRMLVTPHEMFEAGERVQGRLGDVITDPSIPSMLDQVFGPIAPPVEAAPTEGAV